MNNQICTRIVQLMKEQNITEKQLASKLGVCKTSVSKWVNHISEPSIEHTLELAKIFNVSVDYLIGKETSSYVDVEGLTQEQVTSIIEVVKQLKLANRK